MLSVIGSGWYKVSGAVGVGHKIVVNTAAIYDVVNPRARGRTRRRGNRVKATLVRTRDRTDPGDELAGRVRYGLLVSRDGGDSFDFVGSRRRRPFSRRARIRGNMRNVLVSTACDRNGNCGVKILGRFKRR